MGFILFIVIFSIVMICVISYFSSSRGNNAHYTGYNYDDDDEDLYSGDSIKHHHPSSSSFAYPDPYEMSGDKAMFLDEDGELLDDL